MRKGIIVSSKFALEMEILNIFKGEFKYVIGKEELG